jgi:FAD/FMN-containing dehydrogenase
MPTPHSSNDGAPLRPMTVALSGWGKVPVQTCQVYRPGSEGQIASLVGSDLEPSYIARGLGRSYGDAALNQTGGVILIDRNDHFLSFDEASGILDCEAGVSLAEIIDVLLPRGFFLPVTPGTQHVTLGGAIAADVHGKNHHRCGTIAPFVDSLRLLTTHGDVLDCSRVNNAEVFWATIGGMGLTGIILTAKLRMLAVETAFMVVEHERAADLDQALRRFADTDSTCTYSVAWIDCLARGRSLGRSILMRGEHARLTDLTARQRRDPLAWSSKRSISIPLTAPSWVLNPLSIRAFNSLYYLAHPDRRQLQPLRSFFYPLDGMKNWNRLYGRRGFLQYQFVLPVARSHEAMQVVLEELVRARCSSFLAVLKSFGEANDALLSFPVRGHTLALDLPYRGVELVSLLRRLNQKLIEYGGRIYLAKDAVLDAGEFRQMYPKADQFKQVQRRLDPRGILRSSLSDRIGLTNPP